MDSFKDSVLFWSSILGTAAGLFGVVQSRLWLEILGVLLFAASIATLGFAWKERAKVRSAVIQIGGRSIDSLNAAQLRRRLNRGLVLQQVQNLAVIDGEDLTVTWEASGYCSSERETVIEASIDADTNTPYTEIDCAAFDLAHDPKRRHPIRPFLIGPDGISKKVAVAFLNPLSHLEPFQIELKYHLPNCMKVGTEYYTATLAFDQETVPRYLTRLEFLHGNPDWVRVYETTSDSKTALVKTLTMQQESDIRSVFVDCVENIGARGGRIYLFERLRGATEKHSQKSSVIGA